MLVMRSMHVPRDWCRSLLSCTRYVPELFVVSLIEYHMIALYVISGVQRSRRAFVCDSVVDTPSVSPQMALLF